MAEFPALPLFTDAFMADCGHLNDAERGRYILLLMVMWRTPGCRAPDDDAWLAKRFHRTVADVQSEVRPIISEFCKSDGNWIKQKRLSREFLFVTRQSRKQSVRAKSRWNKEKNNAVADATSGIAPTPTPTPTIEDKKDAADAATDEVRLFQRGKAVLGPAAGGLISKLLKAKGNPALAIAAIEVASTKQNPREYIGAMVRGIDQTGMPQGAII